MIKPFARMRQAVTAQVQRVQLRRMAEPIVRPGALYDLHELLRDQGVDTAMIVTTEGFVKRGVVSSIAKDLLSHGVVTVVFSDVKPDPDFACVEQAAELYRERDCEAIVAIGGGSAMDCAKVAGALVARPDKGVRDLVGAMKVGKRIPYLVAVPTTAGTGSEISAAAVVTDTDSQRKYAVSDFALVPDAAILDPNLLVGLSPEMTAYTGMDALTHAVEAYINRYGSHAARKHAEEAVYLIFRHLKASYDDGKSIADREAMLMASFNAGVAFTNAMVGYVHALAHGIGGRYHVQHGLANAVLLPVVLEEYGTAAEPRLAKLAEVVGLGGESDHELATAFIAEVHKLSESMGIPATIPEVREGDIPALAAGAEREGNPAYPVPEIWGTAAFERVLRRVCAEPAPTAEEPPDRDAVDGVPAPEPKPAPDSGRMAAPKRRPTKRQIAAVSTGTALGIAAGAAIVLHRKRR